MHHLKYLKYLIRHKWFVFLSGLKTGAPIGRLIIHDWSKFLPDEWIPYARYFYNYEGQIPHSIQEDFDKAWLLHQRRNKHHWQYWVLLQDDGQIKTIQMPEKYIKEMVVIVS